MLKLPDDFEDYEAIVEAKGWFSEARLDQSGKTWRLTFYDHGRLAQEVDDAIRAGKLFFEPNLVVVESVTRSRMEQAANWLVETGQLDGLAPVK